MARPPPRTASAWPAATILLQAPPMARWVAVGLLMVVTGCGLLRGPAPLETPPPPVPAGPFDSALTHPRTMEWTQRYCGKLTRRSATALGLRPSRPILPRIEAILAEHEVPPELAAV